MMKIKELKRSKKKVVLILENDQAIDINEDIVLDFYLYVNKELSLKDLEDIKESYAYSSALKTSYKILSISSYTTYELKKKLEKRRHSKKIINNVIKKLTSLGYLDDKRYVSEYQEMAISKGYGPQKIKDDLIKKGIKDDIVNSLNFSFNQEDKIREIVTKLSLKNINDNYKKKYQKIYNYLVIKGFSPTLINDILNEELVIDEEIENTSLLRDLDKAKKKYSLKYSDYKLKQKIVESLLKKGYRYENINKYIKELDSYED